ncbi:MAG TPA: ABC transporter ATP-binding protein, partial [Paracoccaceae bacterium]|nr:ABC transporter ATP-binding protein [Paracoccaceae bacterium]
MTGTEPVLEARALRVSYPGAPVLRGLNLAVRRREIVGLMGDAASGKSTAALALMGLARAPGTIDAGEVLFDGRNLLALPEAELRAIRGRDLAIVVQNPRAALNPMTRVGRQIAAVWRAHREGTGGEAAARAVEMLRRVGINDPERRASAFAHELSGGMAQRALIAMALAAEPRLLIADEPTSGLDVTIQAQVLDDLARSVAEAGTAALIVTQDLGVVANYCDRVAVLHDGRIVEDKPVAEFFAAPEHPYSREVLSLQREAARGGP